MLKGCSSNGCHPFPQSSQAGSPSIPRRAVKARTSLSRMFSQLRAGMDVNTPGVTVRYYGRRVGDGRAIGVVDKCAIAAHAEHSLADAEGPFLYDGTLEPARSLRALPLDGLPAPGPVTTRQSQIVRPSCRATAAGCARTLKCAKRTIPSSRLRVDRCRWVSKNSRVMSRTRGRSTSFESR